MTFCSIYCLKYVKLTNWGAISFWFFATTKPPTKKKKTSYVTFCKLYFVTSTCQQLVLMAMDLISQVKEMIHFSCQFLPSFLCLCPRDLSELSSLPLLISPPFSTTNKHKSGERSTCFLVFFFFFLWSRSIFCIEIIHTLLLSVQNFQP